MTISQNFPATRPSLLLDFSNQTVLDPRVTFTRTTTGNYYDNKSAALAEQNLLLQSNDPTNAVWGKVNINAPVVGATDPAGGATGYTLTATAAINNFHHMSQTVSVGAGTYTVSAYLQAGTNNFASLGVYNSLTTTNWATTTFNLTAGSVAVSKTQSGAGGGLTYSSSSVTQVGSTNWWRCSITFISNSIQNINSDFQINSSATPTYASYGLETWLSAGTETILVYGAQLEQHSSPTVYTATTAAAINTYTPTLQVATANSPRFDYDPVTRQSLGLLLEQASTNLALYSSDYTNAAWTKSAVTITPTAGISPDGTQNAQLIIPSSSSVTHNLNLTYTYSAGTTTVSVYAKAYGQNYCALQSNQGTTFAANFDLVNGVVVTGSATTNTTAAITPVGNSWYRCSITFTSTAASNLTYISAANSTYTAYVGNGFNGVLLWGAQVELAPSATSYIATVASAQTRTVDAPSMTGTNFTSWYNYSGGTIYFEAASGNPAANYAVIPFQISDGTTNNSIGIYYVTNGVGSSIKANNVTLTNAIIALPAAIAANTFYKTSYTYSTTGTGISSAGQTATTAATAISVPAVNQINFSLGVSNYVNGHIKKFAYYPTVLTSTQLQSLSAN